MKILIIGSNDRASLVIARSLGREGFTLDNISFTAKTITNYSRYIRKSFYLNNINNDFHNSCEKLFKIIKDVHTKMTTMQFLLYMRHRYYHSDKWFV